MLKNQVTMDNAALHVEETKQVMIVSIKLNITKANMGNIMVGSTGLHSQPLAVYSLYSVQLYSTVVQYIKNSN